MTRSHRAFYIGLGSALTIALIVLTAMRLPMFRGTATETKPAVTAPPAGSTAPAGGSSVDTTAAPPPDARSLPLLQLAPAGAPNAAPAKKGDAEAKRESAEAAARAREEAAAAKAAAEEAARLLEEQENRYTHMSAREGAMRDSFEALRHQQNAAGYGPDSSMSMAFNTMQSLLSRAEAALAAGDAASAKKFMDQAEPQIAILERRFGR